MTGMLNSEGGAEHTPTTRNALFKLRTSVRGLLHLSLCTEFTSKNALQLLSFYRKSR